jgi:uncharacterized protein (TIGR00251 family)
VRVAIRVSPRSKADRLVGIARDADGGRVLKATLAAPAEGGRANRALLQLLARSWQLAPRDLSIDRGARSRNKVVHIAGDARQLHAKITPEIVRLPGW